MGETLEQITSNFGKGTIVGLAEVAVDPVGAVLGYFDNKTTGVGPANRERALPTFSNYVIGKMYGDPDNKLDISKGYFPRWAGKFVGSIAGAAGLGALYFFEGLAAAVAIPVAFGAYSLARGVARYVGNARKGEKIGDRREKATFEDGFKLGYRDATNLFYVGHIFENAATGRGLDKSHIKSYINEGAQKVRRTPSAVIGTLSGLVVGYATSIATLGVLPLCYTIRDAFRIHKKHKQEKAKAQA